MKRSRHISFTFWLLLVIFFCNGARLLAQELKGTVITVNDTGDSVDASPGDAVCADAMGKCTLRAAIEESNATAAQDVIIFDAPTPIVINLTLGELKIQSQVAILGRGSRDLIIQRSGEAGVQKFRIFHLAATTRMRGLTIRNGNSTIGGGILAAGAAGVRLHDIAISENHAVDGGGVAFQGPELSNSIMERCLLTANTADGSGGGVYVAPNIRVRLMSSTFSGNFARRGGAVANYGEVALVNNTIAGNSASEAGSSVFNVTSATVSVINTIIGRDLGQTVTSVEGSFDSIGRNIVTNYAGSTGWISSDQISLNNGIDPMLGPLINNGGQTDSMALLPGSPAVEAGDNCVHLGRGCGSAGFLFDLDYDQRRFLRMASDRVDIGAFETGSAPYSDIDNGSITFGPTQRVAYSRVTITNTRTLDRRFSTIFLWNTGRPATTPSLQFDRNEVYVVEIHTKRQAVSNPIILSSDLFF